jgi:hypothetical protein
MSSKHAFDLHRQFADMDAGRVVHCVGDAAATPVRPISPILRASSSLISLSG